VELITSQRRKQFHTFKGRDEDDNDGRDRPMGTLTANRHGEFVVSWLSKVSVRFQTFTMSHQMAGLSIQSPLTTISVLVIHLLLVSFAGGAASSPVISLAGTDRDKGSVVLKCESKGWYPEPELLWLDAEGEQLSAGPTQTVRGPDDLYTVSSRVTVEKRHSNNFTCRVQQKTIHQTRDTQIHVADDFSKVQSSSAPVITALAVTLAVLIVLLVVFYVWKKRQNLKSRRRQRQQEMLRTEKRLELEKQLRQKEVELLALQEEKKKQELQLKTKNNE
ncbi:hypothetical protein INR49_001670, partial [Caranx melampygus]